MRNSATNGRLSGSATLSEDRCRAFFSSVFPSRDCRRKKDLAEIKKGATFVVGKMAEWSIAAVLKTVELRGSGGSNPSLSANETRYKQQIDFCFLSRSFFIKYIEIEFIRISVYFIKNIFQDERFAVYILFHLQGCRRQAGDHGTKAQRVP